MTREHYPPQSRPTADLVVGLDDDPSTIMRSTAGLPAAIRRSWVARIELPEVLNPRDGGSFVRKWQRISSILRNRGCAALEVRIPKSSAGIYLSARGALGTPERLGETHDGTWRLVAGPYVGTADELRMEFEVAGRGGSSYRSLLRDAEAHLLVLTRPKKNGFVGSILALQRAETGGWRAFQVPGSSVRIPTGQPAPNPITAAALAVTTGLQWIGDRADVHVWTTHEAIADLQTVVRSGVPDIRKALLKARRTLTKREHRPHLHRVARSSRTVLELFVMWGAVLHETVLENRFKIDSKILRAS